MLKTFTFIRHNAIALLALFVALGGTSYAALTINGSQIRNRTIDSVKLDPKSIAGSIKARVDLQFRGTQLIAASSSSPVRVTTFGAGEIIDWVHQRFSAKCLVLAAAHVNSTTLPIGANDGYVNAELLTPNNVVLHGYGPDGSRRPQAASLVLVCP